MLKKQWNEQRQRWEVHDDETGEVRIVTYTVSWTDDEGVRHSKDFNDVDNGYDFFLHKKKWCYNAEWKHNDGFD